MPGHKPQQMAGRTLRMQARILSIGVGNFTSGQIQMNIKSRRGHKAFWCFACFVVSLVIMFIRGCMAYGAKSLSARKALSCLAPAAGLDGTMACAIWKAYAAWPTTGAGAVVVVKSSPIDPDPLGGCLL